MSRHRQTDRQDAHDEDREERRDWDDLERTAFDRAPSAGDVDAWVLLLAAPLSS